MATDATLRKNARRLLIGVPLIGLTVLGAGLAYSGIVSAGTVPTEGSTIAMTITNNTNQTMTLINDYTNSGAFISGPRDVLEPGASEIVTVSTSSADSLAAIVNYGLPDTDTFVTLEANNITWGPANTDGTIITGTYAHSFGFTSNVDGGFPSMHASYSVHNV